MTTTTIQPTDNVDRWYAAATVRNRPRILVPRSDEGEFIFPRSRQPLVDHPEVIAMGHGAVSFILAQSAYKYMYEIGLLETKYVIDCGLNIVNGLIPGADDDEKRDALTIVIDEGYHAYVALDFVIQMKTLTGVQPIEVPTSNGNLDAVARARASLPPSLHHDFQLLSVCLAEHTLTKDLLAIGREKDATRAFTQVMTDHVADEGRHAAYFARLTKAHWSEMSEAARTAIGALLPAYLDDYLAADEGRRFDRLVLDGIGMPAAQVERVIADTDGVVLDKTGTYIDVTKANLVRLLDRIGVLEHAPTRAAFIDHGVAL